MYQLERSVSVRAFLDQNNASYGLGGLPEITSIASVDNLVPNCLSFIVDLGSDLALHLTDAPKNALILLPKDGESCGLVSDASLVFVQNPRKVFIDFLNCFGTAKERDFDGISSLAQVAANSQIEDDVHIDAFVKIGKDVCIGRGTVIHAGSIISAGTKIGKQVVIRPNVVIGFDGQASERDANGERVSLPHVGSVEIGNGTVIGSNSVICRGSLNNTQIGDGCNIGNLVNIGHNVVIDNDCFVSSGATICGSVRIKTGAWVSPSAAILNKIVLGEESIVGIGAVVTKNVARGGFLAGFNARSVKQIHSAKYNRKNDS
jgi:UDP-3-O-[3-hydroxymyristoyl] glucosamine N-acyltransferase